MRPLEKAWAAWLSHVFDPEKGDHSPEGERCRAAILAMFQEQGLGWEKWIKKYEGNGYAKWCGAFVAWCYRDVEDLEGFRYSVAASTWRLMDGAKKGLVKLVHVADVQPEDVVCVGSGDYGSHIVLAVAWDQARSQLVVLQGNGKGRFPDGTWGEGVTLKIISRNEIKAAYRPRKGQ